MPVVDTAEMAAPFGWRRIVADLPKRRLADEQVRLFGEDVEVRRRRLGLAAAQPLLAADAKIDRPLQQRPVGRPHEPARLDRRIGPGLEHLGGRGFPMAVDGEAARNRLRHRVRGDVERIAVVHVPVRLEEPRQEGCSHSGRGGFDFLRNPQRVSRLLQQRVLTEEPDDLGGAEPDGHRLVRLVCVPISEEVDALAEDRVQRGTQRQRQTATISEIGERGGDQRIQRPTVQPPV